MSKEPKDFTYEDHKNYARLMVKTYALHQNNNPKSHYPRSSDSYKGTKLLSDIWKKGESMKEVELLLFRVILTRC